MNQTHAEKLHTLWLHLRNSLQSAKSNAASAYDVQDAIHKLGLGLEETYIFMSGPRTSFEDFSSWANEMNNGVQQAQSLAEDVLSEEDLQHWNKHGYVILRNAISREHAQETEQLVWQSLGKDPADAATWYTSHEKLQGVMVRLFRHPLLDRNRLSARIRKAYEQLYQSSNLRVSIDRVGFNPPEQLRYKHPGTPLHWDVSLRPPYPKHYQGILYLNDVAADQGAFACVPGFQHRLEAWLQSVPAGADPRQHAQQELVPVPIAANAGDLIIWNHLLPHCSTPNHAGYPRIVHYITWHLDERQESGEWL